MPESDQHRRLVRSLRQWIATKFFADDTGLILIDAADGKPLTKPPRIYGFVPDVFARIFDNGLVIGEAKTANDLQNRHTQAQFTAYLRRCAEDKGSLFVVAVPWRVERSAKNLLRNLQRRNELSGVEVVVLEKLGA